MTMQHIETLAAHYADARAAHARLGEAQAALYEAIKNAPDLFEKPKTRVLHNVKFGYQAQPARVTFANEAATIARIRERLPEEQAALMIRTSESVHKPAVYDLSAADLKRLGISVTTGDDRVIIKSTDSAVDKLIKALTADLDKIMEE